MSQEEQEYTLGNTDLTKIYIHNDKVKLDFQRVSGEDTINSHLTSAEKPDPAFDEKLRSLDVQVNEICELGLPSEELNMINLISVTLKYKDGDMSGVVITANKHLKNCPAPFLINTPYQMLESEEGREGQYLGDDGVKIIADLVDHAFAFLNGRRQQIAIDEQRDQD